MDQAILNTILPFVICALAGAVLAIFELIKTFGKWIGRYWRDRLVLALLVINMVTASIVVTAHDFFETCVLYTT